MRPIYFIYFIFITFLLFGCSPEEPSEKTINDFLATRFKNESRMGTFGGVYTKKYSNLTVLNKWSDENTKGVYFIKVSFDYEDKWFASSCIQTWRFVKQGDQWVHDKNPFDKDCKSRGGIGLFQ